MISKDKLKKYVIIFNERGEIVNEQSLESYVSTFDFICSRTKYSYGDRNACEINLKNCYDNKINGSVAFRIGIGESELILFDSQIMMSENSVSFTSKYHYKNFRAKQKPHFIGNGEYTSETETPSFEETDIFTIIMTRKKKKLFDSPKKYLIHFVDGTLYSVYKVDKNYKLSDGIKSNLIPYYFDKEIPNIEYSQVEEFIERKNKM